MKKVLVIEDNLKMRTNLVLMLEMEGFEVTNTDDGQHGVELAISWQPDVILCDVMMPGTDGHEVLKMLRADPHTATIPLIFLTAKGERVDQRTGMDLGADDYLVKPATRAEVLASIEARLQRRQHHEQKAQLQLSQLRLTPDYSSAKPLQVLGLSPREAEVLLWIAQGKNNEEIGLILQASRNTIKKHVQHILEKLAVESRNAAAIVAIEVLGIPKAAITKQDSSI